MKSLLAALLCFLVFTSVTFADDFFGSRISYFKEKSYDFRLSKMAIKNAPKWKLNEEYPPLSSRKAMQIALSQAKTLRPEVITWNIADIKLQPMGSAISKYPLTDDWIYIIRLQDFSGPIAGVPWQLEIPIYMDGSTINPVIEKNKGYR